MEDRIEDGHADLARRGGVTLRVEPVAEAGSSHVTTVCRLTIRVCQERRPPARSLLRQER